MSHELPSGSVTLLFTDIEGSTRLLNELGAEAYEEALADHRRLLREAFARHGGVEVDTQGDAFFYAFPSGPEAIEAAGEGQQALSVGPIRVRMGLHTGRPHVGREGYVGEDVHLAARIAAAGHGGQVLVSQATRALVDGGLADLGEHRVKDFSEPVWIFQLGEERFPPLKTISNTNLPRPASSFVGREREVSDVVELLQDGARLVTLSGPGGSGKTRLAIESAAELVPEFRNGVFWIGLATLRDPTLVAETVAQTLGAKDGLAEHIGERELLLLLDNFEQVVEAAPELPSLLESCPNLRLLVTSRELLRVRGEVEYPVAPLAESEAVELFCARSRLGASDDIAELCRRLDNLPLAVELAAARTSVLTPGQILERLAERLDLLKAGRDAEARQRTLRATIEWSHDLLSADEQRLFARLSVFAGGCTLEAAATVCGADLDTLQSLVDKSLVRHTEERFWMLETIREFALERLEETGGADVLRERYSTEFLELAELAGPELLARSSSIWFDRIEAEHDNIRAVLGDALEHGRTDVALRICAADQAFLVDSWLLERGPSLARFGACSRRGERPTASLRATLGRRSACHLAGGRRSVQRRGGGDARTCPRRRSQAGGGNAHGGNGCRRARRPRSGGRALRGVGTPCARAGGYGHRHHCREQPRHDRVLPRGLRARARAVRGSPSDQPRGPRSPPRCARAVESSAPRRGCSATSSARASCCATVWRRRVTSGRWTSSSRGSPLSGWRTHARIRHAPRACSAAPTRCARKRRSATTTSSRGAFATKRKQGCGQG